MSNKMKTFTRYPGRIALGVVITAVVLAIGAGVALSADTYTPSFIFTNDDGGVDQIDSKAGGQQSDLTRFGIDTGDLASGFYGSHGTGIGLILLARPEMHALSSIRMVTDTPTTRFVFKCRILRSGVRSIPITPSQPPSTCTCLSVQRIVKPIAAVFQIPGRLQLQIC